MIAVEADDTMLILAFVILLALAIACAQIYRQNSALWALPAAIGSGALAAIILPFAFNAYFALVILALPLGYGVYRARVGDTPWARPVAGAAAVLILIIGASRVLYGAMGCADKTLIAATVTAAADTVVYDNGMVKLGQRLAERFPRRRILVVYPGSEEADLETELPSLRKGWGGAMPDSQATAIGAPPPEFFVPRNVDFEGAVAGNPGTELLVSFAPLAADFERLEFLRHELGQRVPIILLRAKPGQIRLKLLQEGLIGAVLMTAPATVPPELAGDVIQFRLVDHLLVDGANLEKVVAAFPTWFPQPK